MGIKANFTDADIAKKLDAALQAIESRIVKRLKYLGELCVTNARINGDYMDQTGNLRSSIGYVVFKDGIAIQESYEVVKDGAEGASKGRALANKVGKKQGFCLVVTAGMSYALKVESMGRDVLASSETIAKQELPKMLDQLKRNINKALDSEL